VVNAINYITENI